MVTMVERMATVETKIDSIDKKLDDFITSADKKYAAKWIEKLNYACLGGLILTVITKISGLW